MSSQLLKRSLQIVEGSDKPKSKKNRRKIKKPESTNDKVEENLKKIMALSKMDKKYGPKNVEKIFKSANPRQHSNESSKPQEEQKSIFTEEDFKKFERELFCDK